MPGLVTVIAVLGLATVAGLLLRRRNGRFRTARRPSATSPTLNPALADLGVEPGTPVTLLQFSSAFCAPCRATRVLCADAAQRWPGIRHLEVDAESHLEAVRALDIWRTPTVLIIDSRGHIVQRASGAPTRARLDAVISATIAGNAVSHTGIGTTPQAA